MTWQAVAAVMVCGGVMVALAFGVGVMLGAAVAITGKERADGRARPADLS